MERRIVFATGNENKMAENQNPGADAGICHGKYLDHKRAFAVKGTGRHDFLVLSGRGSDRNGF